MKIKSENRMANGFLIYRGGRLVVIFHGRGTSIWHESYLARKLITNGGFSVLLFEYPGYGISSKFEGSEHNYYTDAAALLRHIQTTYKFSPKRSVAWGYSLGSGVAVEIAKRNLVSRLVLLSPYTSISDMVTHRHPILAPVSRLLVWDNFDSESKAASIDQPVIILHGREDKIVPYTMSKDLHRQFPNSLLLELKSGNHRLFSSMKEAHWRTLFRFMRAPGKSNF